MHWWWSLFQGSTLARTDCMRARTTDTDQAGGSRTTHRPQRARPFSDSVAADRHALRCSAHLMMHLDRAHAAGMAGGERHVVSAGALEGFLARALFSCFQNSKILQNFPSHQMFQRMHAVLNVAK